MQPLPRETGRRVELQGTQGDKGERRREVSRNREMGEEEGRREKHSVEDVGESETGLVQAEFNQARGQHLVSTNS